MVLSVDSFSRVDTLVKIGFLSWITQQLGEIDTSQSIWLGELYKTVSNPFGGQSKNAIKNNKWQTAGEAIKLSSSINSVAVSVGLEVGIKNIINTAYDMGIKTPLQETKSLCLGSSVVDLFELTNSYCTVVNDGKYNMPIMISRIEDKDGNIIYKAKKHEKQAIPYKSAYLMQIMLRSGLHGTSAGMWEYIGGLTQTTDFGGKTGTSNNHADAWYIGVTPKLVGGVWVGGEFPCIHFRTGALGQGGKAALPIFGDFIKKVLQDKRFSKYKTKFPEAKDIDPKLWSGSDFPEKTDTTFSDENEGNDNSSDNTLLNNDNIDTQTEAITSEEQKRPE